MMAPSTSPALSCSVIQIFPSLATIAEFGVPRNSGSCSCVLNSSIVSVLGSNLASTFDATLALRQAIAATPEGGALYVIPTYTAMLDVRNILGRWAGRGAFWEGDGR